MAVAGHCLLMDPSPEWKGKVLWDGKRGTQLKPQIPLQRPGSTTPQQDASHWAAGSWEEGPVLEGVLCSRLARSQDTALQDVA